MASSTSPRPRRAAVRVARQMGADATWHRREGWDGGAGKEHTHGVLRGCPHNEPARYQLDAVDAGFDGLGTAGRAGPDDGPRPLARRTWEQGIVWARTQQAVETVVRVDELSGRYDRGPALLAAQLAGSAAEADVILVTEVSAARRASALRMDGWTVSRGPDGDRGEVAVLTRDAIWTVRAYAAAVLGPDLGPGGKVVSGIALLEHTGTGARFAPSIAHLPASVEGTWARGRGRADAYLSRRRRVATPPRRVAPAAPARRRGCVRGLEPQPAPPLGPGLGRRRLADADTAAGCRDPGRGNPRRRSADRLVRPPRPGRRHLGRAAVVAGVRPPRHPGPRQGDGAALTNFPATATTEPLPER